MAKVAADGSGLVYAGFIGGERYDYGEGIAVEATGRAYVDGNTGSTEATFPVTVGPDLTYNPGTQDNFVAKIVGGCCAEMPAAIAQVRAVKSGTPPDNVASPGNPTPPRAASTRGSSRAETTSPSPVNQAPPRRPRRRWRPAVPCARQHVHRSRRHPTRIARVLLLPDPRRLRRLKRRP